MEDDSDRLCDKILTDKLENISEESVRKAKSMLINPHLLSIPTRANIILLWAQQLEYQKQRDEAASQEYTPKQEISVCSENLYVFKLIEYFFRIYLLLENILYREVL